jgi:predicted nucleotidyltransferase
VTELKIDILTTLAYFDVFSYPLTHREIFTFLGRNYDQKEFEETMTGLISQKVIYRMSDFYCLQNNPALAERRIAGNKYAKKLLGTAEKVAALLAQFPYVRGIAVSGSLSKNFADQSSDIDFFIITVKNRLWITRTLLHCLKKVSFLFNKEHMFCMNYYVDENELEIIEKNIYTATEVVTLLPVLGVSAFEKFYTANEWTREFLPNNFMRVLSAPEIKKPWIKWIIEAALNNYMGDWLDRILMKITAGRWLKKKKRQKLMDNGFVMSLDAGRHHAKPDPGNFQARLLKSFETRAWKVIQQYEESISTIPHG